MAGTIRIDMESSRTSAVYSKKRARRGGASRNGNPLPFAFPAWQI
jgi:hypothetical protein